MLEDGGLCLRFPLEDEALNRAEEEKAEYCLRRYGSWSVFFVFRLSMDKKVNILLISGCFSLEKSMTCVSLEVDCRKARASH